MWGVGDIELWEIFVTEFELFYKNCFENKKLVG